MSDGDYNGLCRISWRIQGDLAKVFARFSDTAARQALTKAGGLIVADAQANVLGKGWARLGPQIAATMNYQVTGRSLEVGASHIAAGMRHFGGTISAPGQGKGAVGAAWLTIPVKGSPAAGKSAGELKRTGWHIFRVMGKRGPVLMGYRKGQSPQPLFALRKSVQHPAAPWFPTERQIAQRVGEAFLAQR